MSRGVYYISTGADYVEKAHDSARSLSNTNPELSIAIATDRAVDEDLFDHVINISDPAYSVEDKVRYFSETPFDETLYLDSDTYVCMDITEMFQVLRRFDVAGTRPGGVSDDLRVEAPDSFPQMRTNVVVYEDNKETRKLFEIWNEVYDRHLTTQEKPLNQPSFREAIYQTDVDICIFGHEYACDIRYPGIVHSEVKIVKGVGSNKKENAKTINNQAGTRTYASVTVGSERYVFLDLQKWPLRFFHFWLRLRKKGLRSVWKHTLAWIRGNTEV
jgi:hypothetical protein